MRYIFKIRPKFANVSHICLFNEIFVYIVNLCRVIVANYSRTSLRLSHSSEIGALQDFFTTGKGRHSVLEPKMRVS